MIPTEINDCKRKKDGLHTIRSDGAFLRAGKDSSGIKHREIFADEFPLVRIPARPAVSPLSDHRRDDF